MYEASRVVVDASVAAKWYLPERHHRDARRLRDHYLEGVIDLIAPSVFPYEVVNALRYSGQFDEDELTEAAETLPGYGVELVPFHGLTDLVVTAYGIENTIYDAAYVALAVTHDTAVYTADGKLVDGLRGTEYEGRARDIRTVPSG